MVAYHKIGIQTQASGPGLIGVIGIILIILVVLLLMNKL
jgi:hypothetical protein